MKDLFVLYDPEDRTFMRGHYTHGEGSPWWTTKIEAASKMEGWEAARQRSPLVQRILTVPLAIAEHRTSLEVFAAAHKAFA